MRHRRRDGLPTTQVRAGALTFDDIGKVVTVHPAVGPTRVGVLNKIYHGRGMVRVELLLNDAFLHGSTIEPHDTVLVTASAVVST